MTAPIGFTTASTAASPAPAPSAPRGPAPAAQAPFEGWPTAVLDELKNRLLTTAVKDVQYWATQSHPKLVQPARAHWADLFGQAYKEMLEGHRTVTQPASNILLQYYPNNDPRPTHTTLAYIHSILERKLSGPAPDVDEIVKWFGLLTDQEKCDVARHKAGINQPQTALSDTERRRKMWGILGWSDEEKDRVEAQIQDDLAAGRVTDATGPLSLGRAPAPASSGGADSRLPGEVTGPTDLLGQPLDQSCAPSADANPAHPFAPYMSAPLDPAAHSGHLAASVAHPADPSHPSAPRPASAMATPPPTHPRSESLGAAAGITSAPSPDGP